MKIEMLEENKIKCMLTKSDLDQRKIILSNLTYGCEQAKNLIEEIIGFAEKKYNFSAGGYPLLVEAIPLAGDSLIIFISRDEDPSELDTRFSKFTPTPFEVEQAINNPFETETNNLNKANEILNLLSSFKDALMTTAQNISAAKNNSAAADLTSSEQNNNASPDSTNSKLENNADNAKKLTTLVFTFDDMDKVVSLSHALEKKYNGLSSLYRKNNLFYLLINNKNHTPEEFNQICNIICEYGNHTHLSKMSELYFSEHFDVIIKDDALSQLLNL